MLKLQRLCGDSVVHMLTRPQRLNYQFNRDDVEKLDYDDINVRRAITADATKLFSSQKRQRQQAKLMSARKLDSDAIASPKLLESQIGKSSRFAMTRKDLMQRRENRKFANLRFGGEQATRALLEIDTGLRLVLDNALYNDFIKPGRNDRGGYDRVFGRVGKPKAIIVVTDDSLADPNCMTAEKYHSFDATEKQRRWRLWMHFYNLRA